MFRLTVILLAFALSSLINAQSYTISTVAGTDILRDGDLATNSLLQRPIAISVDAAGNLYIADSTANRIRKVTPAGVISTVAGTGHSGYSGDGGPATQADIDTPYSVAVDKNNILYIADYMNNRIRRVSLATGIITTLAGNGNLAASGDGANAAQASFDPYAIAVDPSGAGLYIVDNLNNRIRKIVLSTNIISTVAGTGTAGYSGDRGSATAATLAYPVSLAVDNSNNLYIADQDNSAIRKVSAADGIITTFAGTGEVDIYGDGGPASQAALAYPDAVAIDPTGTQLYILELGLIRAVNLSSGIITAVGGSFDVGFKGDGQSVQMAVFAAALDLAFAPNGDYYIADLGNHRIRKVSQGMISTVAGSEVKDNLAATSGYLNGPSNIVLAANGDLLISDTYNQRIRKVGADGIITTIGGTGLRGSTSGRLAEPLGLAYNAQGDLMFCDSGNDRIRNLTSGGNLTTYAGGATGFAGDGGIGSAARFNTPYDVKLDASGNVYIADTENFRVRKIDAKTGLISTIGGNGRSGSAGVGGPATQTQMNPVSIAPDAAGNVYVADAYNHRVLKIDAASGNSVLIAGTGAAGFSGDGAQAARAQLRLPYCVRLDAAGNLYICDTGNGALRRVTPSGTITTIAGSGLFQFDKETGPALGAALFPVDVAIAPNGNIYVADGLNNRIRKLVPQAAAALAISSGNNQKGDPGARLTIAVKVTDSTGVPVGGITVSFSVVSGAAALSASTAVTAGDGAASVSVTLGSTAGPVVITASTAGVSAIATFNLTVNSAVTVPVPQISSGGVAGAGLSIPAQRSVSVNGIASVFGLNFAPSGTAARVGAADLVGGQVPTAFAGACVLVGGVKAPIFAVYPTQINFQVPAATAGASTVQVLAGCGTAAELKSNSETVTLQPAAPEFFYAKNDSAGHNPVAAIDAVTGAFIGAADLYPGGGFAPAKAQEIVSVFGTSFGATTPTVNPGEIPTGIAPVAAQLKLTLGGRDIPASEIFYVGVTPQNPGLYQLNFRIPADMPTGDHGIVLTIGGAASPSGPYLTVAGGSQ